MNASLQFIERVYAVTLYLYPHRFYTEFSEEMRIVLARELEDAARYSLWAVLALCLRELRDLPLALIREHLRERRNRKMETPMDKLTSERTSWAETFAGLLPFLLFGPVAVIISYPYPPPEWRQSILGSILILIAYLVPVLLGFGAGWAKGFPRWSYPYVGLMLVFLLSIASIPSQIPRMFPDVWLQTLVFGISLLLLFGSVALVARFWRTLLPLYQGIRQDWTRLSFGLFLGASLLFAGIDHDEDPVLTLSVFLPSLILLLGAGVYLRSATKAPRALAMFISLTLATVIRISDGKIFYGLIIRHNLTSCQT